MIHDVIHEEFDLMDFRDLPAKQIAGIVCIGFALLGIYVGGQADDELTMEYIRHGDGVEYTDDRPLNEGGTWRRNPEPTPWEKSKSRHDAFMAASAALLILGIWLCVKG